MNKQWDCEATVPDIPAISATGIVRQLTGVSSWYGKATGHWWALTLCPDGIWRLAEASDPRDLISTIRTLQTRPPPPWRDLRPRQADLSPVAA